MILGIGTDIVHIPRIKDSIERGGGKFINRIFTQGEAEYCHRKKADPYPSFAARFAAKEAMIKCLAPDTKISLKDIEISNDPTGCPHFVISDALGIALQKKGATRTYLSLTHDGEYSAAFVVLEG